MVPPILRFAAELYLLLTTGPIEGCLTQTLTLPQSFHAHAAAVVARWRLHSSGRIHYKLALATFILATHLCIRVGPDFVVCCRLRLPATSTYDLVHRRPGQKCAGEAFYAKVMHDEVVQQLCRPQINSLQWRPSYVTIKEVDGT